MARVKRSTCEKPVQRRLPPLRPAGGLVQAQSDLVQREPQRLTLDLIPPPQGERSLPLNGKSNDLASDHNATLRTDSGTETVVSGSTRRLEGERLISPGLGTPTNSSSSQQEYDVQRKRVGYSTNARENLQNRNLGVRRSSGTSDRTLPSIRQTLLGLRPKPIDTSQLKSLQDVDIVSSNATASFGSPRNGPWSELDLRHRVQSNSASPKSHSARYGGRRNALPKEKKKHANVMRGVGACLRCSLNRITCDQGNPCGPCLTTKMRNWKLGCTRKRLDERFEYLVPKIMSEHLQWKLISSTIESNADVYIGDSFNLPLTQHLDTIINLNVREIEPLGSKLLFRPVFHRSQGGGVDHVERVNLASPPVIPFFYDREAETVKLVKDIANMWEHVKETDKWPAQYFDDDDNEDQKWEREIFRVICEYHRETCGVHAGLDAALRLSFLAYLMVHPFEVPKAAVQELYDRLKNIDFKGKTPDGIVSSFAVSLFVDWVLGRGFQEVAMNVLKHLENYFRSRGKDRSNTADSVAFCESFICLMILGAFQISLIQYVPEDNAPADDSITLEHAKTQIKIMEEEFGTVIIELYLCTLRKSSKKNGGSPQADQEDTGAVAGDVSPSLFERLKTVTLAKGEKFDKPTELGDIDETTFQLTNVGRLLRKFYMAVSKHFGQKSSEDDFVMVM